MNKLHIQVNTHYFVDYNKMSQNKYSPIPWFRTEILHHVFQRVSDPLHKVVHIAVDAFIVVGARSLVAVIIFVIVKLGHVLKQRINISINTLSWLGMVTSLVYQLNIFANTVKSPNVDIVV